MESTARVLQEIQNVDLETKHLQTDGFQDNINQTKLNQSFIPEELCIFQEQIPS